MKTIGYQPHCSCTMCPLYCWVDELYLYKAAQLPCWHTALSQMWLLGWAKLLPPSICGAVRSAASSHAAMRMVAASRPVLVIAWEWHIGLALLCGCSGALEYPTTNSCGSINKSLSLSLSLFNCMYQYKWHCHFYKRIWNRIAATQASLNTLIVLTELT